MRQSRHHVADLGCLILWLFIQYIEVAWEKWLVMSIQQARFALETFAIMQHYQTLKEKLGGDTAPSTQDIYAGSFSSEENDR
mgnify:CR=1 FL=1